MREYEGSVHVLVELTGDLEVDVTVTIQTSDGSGLC